MSQNNYQSAVSEALLKQAVCDNFNRKMAMLPPEDELAKEICFSERHQQNIKRIIRRMHRRDALQATVLVARRAAVVLILLSVTLVGVIMLNPSIRAAVQNVILEVFDTYTTFRFTETAQNEKVEWVPSYVPEGFELSKTTTIGNWTTFVYESDNNEILFFSASQMSEGSVIAIDNENHVEQNTTINGYDAYISIALNDNDDNYVQWYPNGYVLHIWSVIDINELQKMAESVEPKNILQ